MHRFVAGSDRRMAELAGYNLSRSEQATQTIPALAFISLDRAPTRKVHKIYIDNGQWSTNVFNPQPTMALFLPLIRTAATDIFNSGDNNVTRWLQHKPYIVLAR
jgi:hypothetical protein